jgi:hypothetical protein
MAAKKTPAKKAKKKPVKKAKKTPTKKAKKKPAKKKPVKKKPVKKKPVKKKPPKRAPKGGRIKASDAPERLAYVHRRLREGVRSWQERLNIEGWDSQSRTHVNSNGTIDSQVDFYFKKPPKEETVAMLAYDCQRASKIPIMNKKLDRDLYMSTGFIGTHKASGRALYGKGKGELDTFETYPMQYGLGNTTFLTMRDKLIHLVSDMQLGRYFVRLTWSPEYTPERKRKNSRKLIRKKRKTKKKAARKSKS